MTATEATAESSLGDPAPGSAEEGQDQQRPDLAALEAVERACSDVRILVPCNAKLAPQATVYFVFWLFAADLSGPLAPPWPTAVLTKLFESFWGVEATSRCSKCLDGPGGKQVEYRFARPTGAPQLEPERLKRFLHVDLLGLLLQSTEIGNRKGRSYRLELTPETHQYCFGSKPWDTRDWASEALRCWRLLCQRQPTRRCAETASKLASLPKHEPAEAFRRLSTKLGEGVYSQVWHGLDLRPGPSSGSALALKVFNDSTHRVTGGERYGDQDFQLRLLEEAASEIANLHYLQDRFPEAAICFPLFHTVEEVGPFRYRVSVAFPRRECTLADVIESFGGTPLPMDWIERVLDRVLSALEALQLSPDDSHSTHALRDLKSANILLGTPCGPQMLVELCDMQSLVQLPVFSTDRRAKELVKDTPMTERYQAPEVRRGGFAGRHADMWALGCVLMEACKGAPWDVDWSALPTLRDIDRFVEREIGGLAIAHGWVRAVLLNTLKGDAAERLLASDCRKLKEQV